MTLVRYYFAFPPFSFRFSSPSKHTETHARINSRAPARRHIRAPYVTRGGAYNLQKVGTVIDDAGPLIYCSTLAGQALALSRSHCAQPSSTAPLSPLLRAPHPVMRVLGGQETFVSQSVTDRGRG